MEIESAGASTAESQSQPSSSQSARVLPAREHPHTPPAVPAGVRPRWMGDTWVVTPGDAGIIAGVSRRTIYNWIGAKLVQIRTTPSGLTRVVIESLWQQDGE